MNRTRTSPRRRLTPTVGVDIGKRTHAAAGLDRRGERVGRTISFPCSRRGLEKLIDKFLVPLGGPGKVEVAMEATGHYWFTLYHALADRGYEVSVYNPS